MKNKDYISPVRSILVTIMAVFILFGCEQARLINDAVMSSEKQADQALKIISPDGGHRASLSVDERPWYGSRAVQMRNGKNLPSSFMQSDSIVMTFAGPKPIFDVMRSIEDVTGISVSLSNNIYDSTMGDISSREFLPTGGVEVSGGRIIWSGDLKNLLDQIANTYGAEWVYDDVGIMFSTELTKTFMLNALAGNLTISDSASSGTGGGATANIPDLSVGNTAILEIWGEVTEAIGRMIGDKGQASFSPSTGSVTVTARPDVLRRVENYLRLQNERRLRRIAVSIKVLSVKTSDDLTVGADITGVIKAALGQSLQLEGSADGTDGLSLSILKNPTRGNNGDIASTLEADEGIERVSIVHSGSIVTLSDQPAPLQVGRQIAYLERVSSSGDAGSVSLEPGTVDVGLFMTVLPRIVQGDRVLMRLSIAVTDADPNFRTFGTDEIQIELPEINTTGFLQNAVLGNGETMVLAGFEKSQNSLNDDGTPGFFLGGTRKTNRGRDLTVLIINARILPEEQITVIGQ